MGRMRCPDCGKRVPDKECTCPRCGLSIPCDVHAPVDEMDVPWEQADSEIDDPELLAQVEEYVKSLPNLPYQGRGALVPGSEGPGGLTAGKADVMDDGILDPELLGRSEKNEAPKLVGSECPACGRQAQKGWARCPWCGTTLSLGESR